MWKRFHFDSIPAHPSSASSVRVLAMLIYDFNVGIRPRRGSTNPRSLNLSLKTAVLVWLRPTEHGINHDGRGGGVPVGHILMGFEEDGLVFREQQLVGRKDGDFLLRKRVKDPSLRFGSCWSQEMSSVKPVCGHGHFPQIGMEGGKYGSGGTNDYELTEAEISDCT